MQINTENCDKIYYLITDAYFIKLNMNIPIDKYDLINNGNMGYKGDIKYIKEIDNYCNENKCLFILNNEKELLSQLNENIINYVTKQYNRFDEYYDFVIYTN